MNMEAKAREYLGPTPKGVDDDEMESRYRDLAMLFTEARREGRNSALSLGTVRALMNEGMEEAAKVVDGLGPLYYPHAAAAIRKKIKESKGDQS